MRVASDAIFFDFINPIGTYCLRSDETLGRSKKGTSSGCVLWAKRYDVLAKSRVEAAFDFNRNSLTTDTLWNINLLSRIVAGEALVSHRQKRRKSFEGLLFRNSCAPQ